MAVRQAAPLYVDFKRLQMMESRGAARALIRALDSSDEDIANMAGIFLVRAGHKAVPELLLAIERRPPALACYLGVLADIGGNVAETTLKAFAQDDDPEVARAASEGLKDIAMEQKLARGESPFSDPA